MQPPDSAAASATSGFATCETFCRGSTAMTCPTMPRAYRSRASCGGHARRARCRRGPYGFPARAGRPRNSTTSSSTLTRSATSPATQFMPPISPASVERYVSGCGRPATPASCPSRSSGERPARRAASGRSFMVTTPPTPMPAIATTRSSQPPGMWQISRPTRPGRSGSQPATRRCGSGRCTASVGERPARAVMPRPCSRPCSPTPTRSCGSRPPGGS